MPPDASTEAPRDVVDRLYGVGLDEFVPTRTAAAKELRGQGRRDEAAAVQALGKPSVAAWIVNRLARDEQSPLADLLTAGAELREAQLSAGSPAEIRAAGEAERAALDAVMRAAAEVSTGAGLGTGSLERVRETLHAAALDPDLADQVRRGVVLREQQAVGFPLGAAVPAAAGRKPARPRRETTARGGDRRPSSGKSAAATRRLERATAAAETAQEALAEAERRLADAREAQAAAARELEATRKALTATERRAREAERAAERAAAARKRAAGRAEQAAERRAAAEEAE